MRASYEIQDYKKALDYCLKAIKIASALAELYIYASVCCCKLFSYKEGIDFALKALKLKGDSFALFDSLAHCYGSLYDFEECKKYGRSYFKYRNSALNLS